MGARSPFEDCSIALLDTDRSEDFFNLIDANRSRLENFFSGTVARTRTLEDTKDYCQVIKQRLEEKLYFPFMISDHRTGKYIGLVDIKSINWSVPKAEIGYFIDQRYAGQGIITEALAQVIRTIVNEHGFRKLLCRINRENVASITVVRKNGFELEGTIRNDYVTTNGQPVDLEYYGRVF